MIARPLQEREAGVIPLVIGLDRDGDGIDDMLSELLLEDSLLAIHYSMRVTSEDLEALEARGNGRFTIDYVYRYIDAVRIRCEDISWQDLEEIVGLPGVSSIQKHPETRAFLDVSVPAIMARQSTDYSPYTAWDLGITGKNVVVAITDTGVDDVVHESLRGKFVQGADFSGLVTMYNTNPDDENGHGTHCSSIAIGNGGGTGTYAGVAPDSELVDCKIATAIGDAMASNLDNALEWIMDNQDTLNVSVITISYGSSYSSSGKDTTSLLVNSAVDDGITVCVAIGNDGDNKVPSPSAADKAISVGAVGDGGTVSRGDDSLAYYSNYGPRPDDGDSDDQDELKPDVVAPGSSIMAAKHNSVNAYITKSGTSMACPHVAGVCALMKEADPEITPAQIKAILHRTAQQKGDVYDENIDPKYNKKYGWGEVDAFGAVKTLLDVNGGTITGPDTIQPLETGLFKAVIPYTRTPYITTKDQLSLTIKVPSDWSQPYGITLETDEAVAYEKWHCVPVKSGDHWTFTGTFNFTSQLASMIMLNASVTFKTEAPGEAAVSPDFLCEFSLDILEGKTANHSVVIKDLPLQGVDLFVGDISFSNNLPDQGEYVTIFATINNTGSTDVEGVSINITDGQEPSGIHIATLTGDVPAGNYSTMTTQWQATPGDHRIYVSVDPQDEVDELNENNNTDSSRIFVMGINPGPEAVLTAYPTEAVIKETVHFDGSESYDTNIDDSGSVIQYNFDFGDGQSSGWLNYPNTTHQYLSKGSYIADLTVKDNGGVESTNEAQEQINVTEGVKGETTLYLNANDTLTLEMGAYLKEKTCPNGLVIGGEEMGVIKWKDVGEWRSLGASTTHLLYEKVTFSAWLYNSGQETVSGAVLGYRLFSEEGGEITPGEVVTDPVDLAPDEKRFVGVTYEPEGSHRIEFQEQQRLTIRCKVEGDDVVLLYGSTDHDSNVYYRYTHPVLEPPVADAGEDKTGHVGEDLEFTGTASDIDGGIHNYTWDFGDGTVFSSTQTGTATHAYEEPGVFTALFTVYDDDGLGSTDTASVTIQEYNSVPEVQITSPWNNSQVTGVVNVTGKAYDKESLERVELRINEGDWKAVNGLSEWFFNWDSEKYTDGNYTIWARAFDSVLYSEAVSIVVQVKNKDHSPEITNIDVEPSTPIKGIDMVTFRVTVEDKNGREDIDRVFVDLSSLGGGHLFLYDDGLGDDQEALDMTYSGSYYISEDTPTGEQVLEVRVSDKSGNLAKDTFDIKVLSPFPSPIIEFINIDPTEFPGDRSTDILVEARITDPDGASDLGVVRVDLSDIGGPADQPLNDDGTHGDRVAGDHLYSFQFTTSAHITLGEKTLEVYVEDHDGNSDTSTVEVLVRSSEPEEEEEGGWEAELPFTIILLVFSIIVLALVFVGVLVLSSRTKGQRGKVSDQSDEFEVLEARIIE